MIVIFIILLINIILMYKFNYIIFHKGCLDGFSSFIILHHLNLIMDNAMIHPDVPSSKYPPKNLQGKDVIIMDVAYKSNVLKEIVSQSNSVLFIDHHTSIKDEISLLKKTMM